MMDKIFAADRQNFRYWCSSLVIAELLEIVSKILIYLSKVLKLATSYY